MKKIFALIGTIGIATAVFMVFNHSPQPTRSADPSKITASLGKLPLYFEPYQDQAISRGRGYVMYFAPDQVTMSLSKTEQKPAIVTMSLIGANPNPKLSLERLLEGKSNYLIGADPKEWRTDVPHYAKVIYRDVYPGIDLEFYGNQQQLEYDWVVAPGVDPSVIKMTYKGIDRKSIDGEGNLVLSVNGGSILHKAPIIYQEANEQRQIIRGEFVLKGDLLEDEVQFKIAAYDKSRPLRIDPILAYSTFLGKGDPEFFPQLAVDTNGNAYVTGVTESINFPTQNPFQSTHGGGRLDAFITKLNTSGNGLIYSTYLGGSEDDLGHSIAVDSNGSAYVAGMTASSNFPTLNPFQGTKRGGVDAFITKLNGAGNGLVYSTYLGGFGDDVGTSIIVDSNRNAYLNGFTGSTDFPTQNPFQGTQSGEKDAFITKLNAAGNGLVYSTYLGGRESDIGHSIAVDSNGNVYVCGDTRSTDFPTLNPFQGTQRGERDAFITKLNAAGNGLVYSTYLGGSWDDRAHSLKVDDSGHAYVTGETRSTDFPTLNPFQGTYGGSADIYITKLNTSGNGLVYSTYLGGSKGSAGTSITVDSNGNAYVVAKTEANDLPTQNPLQAHGGQFDAYIMKLNAVGNGLAYSTYLGGSNYDAGNSIALDSNGSAYVTGVTESNDFPTQNPFQGTHGGGSYIFVAKLTCSGSQPAATPCQSYVCDLGADQWVAVNKPSGSSCADNNRCNGAETCNASGMCVAGTPVNIDDGNACTADSCDQQTGLVLHSPRPVGTSCNDNTACTTNDRCEQGVTQNTRVCRGTPLPGINDNNPCTTDTCNATTGVIAHHPQTGTSCSDGRFCNGAETCQAGMCQPGAVPKPNQCQNPDCSEALKGFPPKTNGTVCNDSNRCTSCDGKETGADCCQEGVCRGAWQDGCYVP